MSENAKFFLNVSTHSFNQLIASCFLQILFHFIIIAHAILVNVCFMVDYRVQFHAAIRVHHIYKTKVTPKLGQS